MKIELNENRAVTRLIEKIARLTLRKISLLMKLISSIASAEYLSILTVFSNWCVSKGQTRTRLVKIWIHKSLAKQSKALHYKRKNSSLETLTFKKKVYEPWCDRHLHHSSVTMKKNDRSFDLFRSPFIFYCVFLSLVLGIAR